MGRNNKRKSQDRRAGSSDNWWQGKFDQNKHNNNNNNRRTGIDYCPLKKQQYRSDDTCYSVQEVQQFADHNMTCLPDYAPWETIHQKQLPHFNLETIREVPIHQILSKRNFQIARADVNGRELLEDCPGLDYWSLKQALHLASCFLVVSIPFWHTIFEGKLRPILGAPTRSYEFVENNEAFLFGDARKRTMDLLQNLAQYVKFEVNQDPQATSCTVAGEDITGHGHDFSHGKQSTIYLSQQKVLAAMAAAQDGADPLFKAAAMFDIARDIAHELTHAAIFAARGTHWRAKEGEMSWYRAKFFFKGNPVADGAFELEHRMLGGRIEFVPEEGGQGLPTYYLMNGRPSAFQRKVISLDRPQQNIRCIYDDFAAKTGLRAQHAPVFQAHYVHMALICQLFQADFWYLVGQNGNQIPSLKSVYAVNYRYPSSPIDHYAPLDSPRLAEEAGWDEAESRPAMQLCHFSSDGLPRGCSASLRVLEQRQEVAGTEEDDLMDIDGGFVYVGHGPAKVVKSEVFEIHH
ncbi:hypothetical protein CLAFUW4_12494 [Fulvia fulva]|uniref:Uncharacterized protein n=1 Tax=Passalora fulva TaxID=5499 RepID=A0A9Q8USR3_PASFU|nr:uncharacterized protein CLAFUR5_11520 [Fulvia fulva]KAK4617860.1 hypothetical protein CLAFUR4_12499 [Fulvia fulva]KAK4618442.1 hypothetical protein CLAFUR0_12510 [Fulvia fulva]UJO21025.1 hypothetical protein CLAFUR5_11520 [Fulvia fulva]WPV18156.1 hypothetical protein CLAFUW4_12494 [Fulvia fulva]WPV33222.1 hypothetical protein CLAFUW7_12501 [Fulvia fulva]